ncbi:MAG: hypothetical protein JWM28_2825 [Chitinophagaceae bacterium]|nr:hypothetical protein [Chitinophagaceae bacterium]
MASQTIFQVFLLFHLTGFAVLTGTLLLDTVTLSRFWKPYHQDKLLVNPALQAIAGFPRLMGIAFGLLILSGVGMMAMTQGLFGEQIWFRIKFGIILTIIIVRLTSRKQGVHLRETTINNQADNSKKIEKIKNSLSIFNGVQLALLFIIILLSVFKFN